MRWLPFQLNPDLPESGIPREEYVARKFRGRNLTEYLADPSHLASAYRKLRYAGFGSSACIRVLKRYSDRAEEIEE